MGRYQAAGSGSGDWKFHTEPKGLPVEAFERATAPAAEAEVARQEQEAAAEVVRLEEEAAEQKRQAKLREASIDDLRVLVETFLGENYTEENADIFHKAVLAIIEKKGIKVDPDILEGGDRNALKTWVTNVLREID